MLVAPSGDPPPHRHDIEEMFTILDGEIEVAFRVSGKPQGPE
jgi:quercetin dioxygenase-like cupin family protein